MIARSRSRVRRAGLNGLGLLVSIMAIFPVYWMILTSLRRGVDIQSPNPSFLPFPGTLDNYRRVFERDYFWTAVKNSLMVTAITVVVALLIAFLAAVALARFRFWGRKGFLAMVLIVQMIPAEAMVISMFRVLDGWQLINTVAGLSLTYLVFVLPFTIWTLRGFVAALPVELEEAAMIDGASRLRVFIDIVLPSAAPGIIAAAIFSLIVSWNDFLFARVFINSIENLPLTVGVMHFFEGTHVDWGLMMASAVLMTVPMAILFMLMQRHLVAGFGAGAVKG